MATHVLSNDVAGRTVSRIPPKPAVVTERAAPTAVRSAPARALERAFAALACHGSAPKYHQLASRTDDCGGVFEGESAQ